MEQLSHSISKWMSLHTATPIITSSDLPALVGGGEGGGANLITKNVFKLFALQLISDLKISSIIASKLMWNAIDAWFPLNPRGRLVKKRICRSCVLEGTPKMVVEESNLEPADSARNWWATGAATSTLKERGLDGEDVVPLRVDTGLSSMAGNHGNSAAYCRQGCWGKTVWLCVQWPQIAFSSFSFVCFETKSLPAKNQNSPQ